MEGRTMRSFLPVTFLLLLVVFAPAQEMPFVYDVENTCVDCLKPYMPSVSELPVIEHLPDPFAWADGRGRLVNRMDWRYRRAEISAQVQHYEIGYKPAPPETLLASFANNTLTVLVIVDGDSLTLTATITYPDSGTGPFPAVIGVGWPTGSLPQQLFLSRGVAGIAYNFSQVAPWTQEGRGRGGFYKLYPDPKVGYFTAWAWGVSRIIDGLEKVPEANIDLRHLAITGCSFAGKIALFSGALDERIALTISQEPGGGGDATWRFSQTITDRVETLSNAQSYGWYHQDVSQFNTAVTKLPFDHHEVMALIAPRALLVIGNPSMVWLAEESGYVGCKAAHEVWKALGVPDRFGFSKVGHSDHCGLPTAQYPEVIAFIEKFLLENQSANTNVAIHPGYTTNLSPWIPWTTPTLGTDTSYFEKPTIQSPHKIQLDIETDTTLTFVWSTVPNAAQYFFQLSTTPLFTSVILADSTIDTTKAVNGFQRGKNNYWRVRVQNINGQKGPWSEVGYFTIKIPLPAKTQLASAAPPLPNRADYIRFKWYKVEYADQYLVQMSTSETFNTLFAGATTWDTTYAFSQLREGTRYYWRVRASNITGAGPWSDVWNFVATIVSVDQTNALPTEYSLYQNFPNPFNPTTTIHFALPERTATTIVLFDVLGQTVQTLLSEELDAGYHHITFDGTHLPSGIYFYQIRTKKFSDTKKMLLLR